MTAADVIAGDRTEASVRAYLELLGALLRASHEGRPSRLRVEEWDRLLACLTHRDRSAVVLVHLAGMTDAELAADWGVTRTRVWQHRQRGLRLLRRRADVIRELEG